MNFKEDSFMVAIALCVVFFVVAQALFFLVRAVKRAKELGIANQTIKNTIVSSSLFTIAPAIGIVATVLTLSAGLGYVLPWIRLTVIGNISYEVTAATNAVEAFGLAGGISQPIENKEVFATVQSKMNKAVSKNSALSSVLSAAAFIGLISAFVARAIAGKGDAHIIGDGAGILSITALISSVILMLIMQKLAGLEKLKWLESFAMPFAMIGAMAIVMIMAQILPADVAFLEWRG